MLIVVYSTVSFHDKYYYFLIKYNVLRLQLCLLVLMPKSSWVMLRFKFFIWYWAGGWISSLKGERVFTVAFYYFDRKMYLHKPMLEWWSRLQIYDTELIISTFLLILFETTQVSLCKNALLTSHELKQLSRMPVI